MTVVALTALPLLLAHLLFAWRHRPLLRFQLLVDLVLAAVLGRALLTGADLNPVRCLQNSPPFTAWRWQPSTELQPVQSDLVLQFHPWWEATRRQLLEGHLPVASPRIGAGLPLLANGQTGLLAPVMLPVWWLGPERGTTVMAFWKLEAACLGAFLLLGSGWRLRFGAAALGGLAYGAGCYQVAWLLVPLSWVTAALPFVWYGTMAVLRRRARWRAVLGLGAACGYLLGCGLHPESAAIAIGSALLGGLVLHPRRWLRLIALALTCGAVGVGLSWPTLGLISSSAKLDFLRTEQPNRAGLEPAVQLAAVQQLLVPTSQGYPARGDWTPSYPHAAAATGIGGAALAAVALGRPRRRHRRLLVAALASIGVAALLAYRLPPFDWLLVRLPPFDRMTLPRFAVLAPWGLALCAALGLEGALAGRRLRLGWRLLAPAAVAGVAVVALSRPLAQADLALTLLTALLCVAVAALRPGSWVAVAAGLELALLAIGVNPVASPVDRLPRPPLVVELERLVAAHEGRVIGLGGALRPNLASRYGLADLRAFDPLRPAPFARLLGLLGEPEPILGGPLTAAPAGLCGAWSVRYLVTPPGADAPGWRRVFSDPSGELWENPRLLPELRLVGRSLRVEDDEAGRLLLGDRVDLASTALVEAGSPLAAATRLALEPIASSNDAVRATATCDGPCLLTLARPWAPGWRALVDGTRHPLVRVNVAGLGVMLPAGSHRVELVYNPWRWAF